MEKIIIFTGKGGVGKTSIAAAHARHSALNGVKTLILSTDMAHNLGDVFGLSLGKKITHISQNLDALEIDPNYIMENDFSDIKKGIAEMFQSSSRPLGEMEQISLFPGMDELFSLLKIKSVYEEGVYERIIVDCAPTGETLALLKFPELLSWYIEKFLPVGKFAMRVLSPISKKMFKIQLPNKEAMSDVERLFVELIALQELLKDKNVTSIKLVSMPEKMVVEETKRSFMYMNLYNFNVDGIYINRILPRDIDNSFFDEWIVSQNQYIEELEIVFGKIPIYKVPWFDCALNGLDGVDLIENVLRNMDVFRIVEMEESEEYIKLENGYLLKMYLPNIDKADLNMHETNSDIIIKIGNFKRSIPKPNVLRNHEITDAKLENQILKITLIKKQKGNEEYE